MSRRTWVDEWNAILRDIIFSDQELKSLMMIPQKTNIIQFIDRYFIRAGYTSKTLKDEPVRIIYGNVRSTDVGSPAVTRERMSFDIYVKYEYLHNSQNDRLVFRNQMIAIRLKQLLLRKRYYRQDAYRFWVVNEGDLGTSTIGYSRYNITFEYMKTVD